MFSPRRFLIIVAAFVALAAGGQTFAGQPKVITSVRADDVFIRMPRPAYPLEAREKRITGRGMYQVLFRPETGVVTRVTVLESTGSKLLDQAAITALSQWRARPGRISRMHVPFTFTFAR
jgi:TonB family protein